MGSFLFRSGSKVRYIGDADDVAPGALFTLVCTVWAANDAAGYGLVWYREQVHYCLTVRIGRLN